MNVVWKRPDGFHDANPSDYLVIEIAGKSKIWLHKKDKDNYPFRISSDWQGEDQTKDLNNLVNLLSKDYSKWCAWIKNKFSFSKSSTVSEMLQSYFKWLEILKENSKGDSWEIEIIHSCLDEIKVNLDKYSNNLMNDVNT